MNKGICDIAFYQNLIALRPEWAEIKISEDGAELTDKEKKEIIMEIILFWGILQVIKTLLEVIIPFLVHWLAIIIPDLITSF